MKHYFKRSIIVLTLGCMVGSVVLGCANLPEPEETERPGNPDDLQEKAREFHTNLRWARYDHAIDAVHEAYEPAFQGEFEERGDDYEIVQLDMKNSDIIEEGFETHIEVEQQWYQLPSTVVQKERFVERWIYEDEEWQLRERLMRDEFRERDETFDSQQEDEDDAGVAADSQGEDATTP